MLAWFRRFRECWTLARRIQRGELVALSRDELARLSAIAPGLSRIPVELLHDEPEVEVPPSPGMPFRVVLSRAAREKLLYEGEDSRLALKAYSAPYTSGAVITMYKHAAIRLQRDT